MSKLYEAGKGMPKEEALRIAIEHGMKIKNCKCVETLPMMGRKCTYCGIQEMTDVEHEKFADRAFEDQKCVDAFIKDTYEDFVEHMEYHGVDWRNYCDHETSWCEKHMDRFLEFAFGFFNKQKAG